MRGRCMLYLPIVSSPRRRAVCPMPNGWQSVLSACRCMVMLPMRRRTSSSGRCGQRFARPSSPALMPDWRALRPRPNKARAMLGGKENDESMAGESSGAVIGTGYFGGFHADHYARNKRARLLTVVDINEDRARAVAAEFGAEPAFDYRSVLGKVDAVSVAVPTPEHYQIACDLLEAGIHVLVEKPIADTVERA